MCEETSIKDKTNALLKQKKLYWIERLKAVRETKIEIYNTMNNMTKREPPNSHRKINITTLLHLKPSQIEYPR
jgi:hypothetical protein